MGALVCAPHPTPFEQFPRLSHTRDAPPHPETYKWRRGGWERCVSKRPMVPKPLLELTFVGPEQRILWMLGLHQRALGPPSCLGGGGCHSEPLAHQEETGQCTREQIATCLPSSSLVLSRRQPWSSQLCWRSQGAPGPPREYGVGWGGGLCVDSPASLALTRIRPWRIRAKTGPG